MLSAIRTYLVKPDRLQRNDEILVYIFLTLKKKIEKEEKDMRNSAGEITDRLKASMDTSHFLWICLLTTMDVLLPNVSSFGSAMIEDLGCGGPSLAARLV